jgi:hypothetical protein
MNFVRKHKPVHERTVPVWVVRKTFLEEMIFEVTAAG